MKKKTIKINPRNQLKDEWLLLEATFKIKEIKHNRMVLKVVLILLQQLLDQRKLQLGQVLQVINLCKRKSFNP